MNNYVKTMIYQMARRTGTELSQRHWEILSFANEYYHRYRVGPLYHVMKQKMGVSKLELDRLFPVGLNSVYNWVGIPIQTPSKLCKPIAEIHVDEVREVFLDHNGTTYLRPEVKRFLSNFAQGDLGYGNPSSSTTQGKDAYELIHQARAEMAKHLDVGAHELVFTGCGSESNNMAIKGIAFQHLEKKGHIITSRVEHSSVLETMAWLEKIGFDVTYLEVTPGGQVLPEVLEAALRPETRLVSIMLANNEIGTINPMARLGEICHKHKVPLMADAAQAFGKICLRPKEMGVSLLSFTGHKFYAPKGVGGLFVDESLKLVPLLHGGGQEMDLRAGTENVSSISAMALASKLAHQELDREHDRIMRLRDYFLDQLDAKIKGYIINGSMEHRVVNNLNIGFPQVDSGALLLSLNQIGIYVSSGSACHAGSKETSHVLQAIHSPEGYGNIRFSFGLETTTEDLDYLFEYLPEIISQLKENSPNQRVG